VKQFQVVAAVVLCVAGLAGCGNSSVKHVAVGSSEAATTTTDALADTSSTITASVSGGTSGTASVSPGSSHTTKTTTARPGPTPPTTAPRTTSTTRAVASGTTGVHGAVLAGPTCPVQRQGDPSCADKPVPAHLVLQRGDGSTAATGDAGNDGQFFIAVSGGTYALTATSPQAMRCATQSVTVSDGHVTDVNVSCDTGIR